MKEAVYVDVDITTVHLRKYLYPAYDTLFQDVQ